AAEADALVRRAPRLRPALVQCGGTPSHRRSPGADRSAAGGARRGARDDGAAVSVASAAPGGELLRCPARRGAPRGDDELRCGGCGRTYPVLDGIPRVLDETVPGVADKAREAEGWAAMARDQGWYEPDDEVDAVLPYLTRDRGWDDLTWKANEHSF